MGRDKKGIGECLLKKIKEYEENVAEYKKRLEENPGDLDIAETLMTLQVALEELR